MLHSRARGRPSKKGEKIVDTATFVPFCSSGVNTRISKWWCSRDPRLPTTAVNISGCRVHRLGFCAGLLTKVGYHQLVLIILYTKSVFGVLHEESPHLPKHAFGVTMKLCSFRPLPPSFPLRSTNYCCCNSLSGSSFRLLLSMSFNLSVRTKKIQAGGVVSA